MSGQNFKDDESVKFLQDPDVTNKFSNCKALSDVNPGEYDAVFYVGGRVSISSNHGVNLCQLTSLTLPQDMDRLSISRMILKMRNLFQR